MRAVHICNSWLNDAFKDAYIALKIPAKNHRNKVSTKNVLIKNKSIIIIMKNKVRRFCLMFFLLLNFSKPLPVSHQFDHPPVLWAA